MFMPRRIIPALNTELSKNNRKIWIYGALHGKYEECFKHLPNWLVERFCSVYSRLVAKVQSNNLINSKMFVYKNSSFLSKLSEDI